MRIQTDKLTRARKALTAKYIPQTILTARPEGMPFEDYQKILKVQSRNIKKIFKSNPQPFGSKFFGHWYKNRMPISN